MAISGGDGSIILTTSVDTSGIKKGLKDAEKFAEMSTSKQRSLAQSLSQIYRKQGMTQSEAQRKAWKDLKESTVAAEDYASALNDVSAKTKAFGNQSETSAGKAKTAFTGLKTTIKTLATYFIGIQTVLKAFSFSGEASAFATQTEASVQRLVDIYGEASESVGNFIDVNAHALGMSKAAAASFSSVYGNLFSVWADQATNAELTNRYLNMTAVVASKTGRTVQDVQERIRSGLLGNTEAIEDLGVFVNVKTIEMTDAFQRMANGRSWEQLDAYAQQQIRTMAILEQATSKYGNTVANTTATTRAQYQAAYEDFKNTWGQVVNTILIPVLNVATQVLNVLTRGLQIIAGITGKTIKSMQSQTAGANGVANAIGGAVDNQNALTDATKKTAKEQKKMLAEFDEIKKLSDSSAESGGAGSAGAGTGGISGLGSTEFNGEYDNSFVDKINTDLAVIMGYVGFALVAIGIILICFGQIAWGIGFVIAGAAIFAVSQAALSEGEAAQKARKVMNGIIAGISLLALVLGIILVATGASIPLGVGLIIVGVAGIATAVALNWNTVKNSVKKFVDKNAGLIVGVASALIVLGIILCMVGVITPLSIGLIVAGAAILATTVALNWDDAKNSVKKFLQDNAGLIVGISLAILVVGIILCVCGIITPLSIGMIVFGAAGLAATVALNWDKVKNSVSNFLKSNQKLIVGVSLALLVLGIILCCTGVALPLGIGLIVAGAGGLASVVALNWDAVKEKVSTTFTNISNWVQTWGILILGIILVCSGTGMALGLALMKKGGASLTEAQDPMWNSIVDKVKSVWQAVKSYWDTHIAKWFTFEHWAGMGRNMMNGLISKIESGLNNIMSRFNNSGIGSLLSAVSGGLGVSIPTSISIPRLAKGAVIPPNNEFLAVLGDQKRGTNIEAPLETIKQAVAEVIGVGVSNSGDINLTVNLDGKTVYKTIIKRNNESIRMTGKNPLAPQKGVMV